MGLGYDSQARQRGQTIALVAVSMVSLLAVSALAIDLTTLYVARSEIQHAADAAALAGAKAFVDSGVTTDPSNASLQNLAQNMANAFVTATLSQNHVAGAAPSQVGRLTPNFTLAGNPRITVTLQRTGLPLFFARIWGNASATVSASAIAEAYNPAYSQNNTTAFVPSAPKCVKPFLVPNYDKKGTPVFVNSSGAVNTAAGPFLGEKITLTSACSTKGPPSGCSLRGNPAMASSGSGKNGEYLPMEVPDNHQYCPSTSATGCSQSGRSDFEKSIECCDGVQFDFQQCGSSATAATWDPSINPGPPNLAAQEGIECLIHIPDQDRLDPSNFLANTGPFKISPGPFSQTRYGVPASALIGTSDSIVAVPLFDNRGSFPGNQVRIVGFLQLFVNDVGPGRTDVNAYILNVVGCGDNSASGAAVSGGGSSPIPVRLIRN